MVNQTTVLLIDGYHIFRVVRNLGFDIDFSSLLTYYHKHTELLRPYYFTTVLENDEYTPAKPLTDWLAYNRFTVITKEVRETLDREGRRRVSGSIDVEIAVTLMEVAEFAGRIILFAGDGDYCRPVESVQRKGVHVTLVSSMKTNPIMVSDSLRRAVDAFQELDDLRDHIARRMRT
jgi:uncharacterized LabA/DUF88 family protein